MRAIPTIRDKVHGHAQGVQLMDVPLHYAGYMLHLAAATIQFLVESERALR